MPREQVQLPLEGEQLILVFLLVVDPFRKVQGLEDVHAVQGGRRRMQGQRWHHRSRMVQAGPHPLQQDLPHREALVAGVGGLHHDPWRVGRAGGAQSPLSHLPERVVHLEMLPIPRCHAPAGLRILLQALQPFLLLPLAEVHPEFQHQGALVDEHLLEARHPGHVLVQVRGLGPAVGSFENRPRIPGAVEDPHPPLGRQQAPVAPHIGSLQLFVRRLGQAMGLDVARIHPLVERVHGLALAGPVHARHQDDHGELRRGEVELRIQKGLSKGGNLPVPHVLVDPVA